MRYLLDTNVISEVPRRVPDAGVMSWLQAIDETDLYLSVVSIAEIEKGISLLPSGSQRVRLETWAANDLALWFSNRLIGIDVNVAKAWGRIMAQARRAGRAVPAMDGFLAATALTHGLTLATRNVKDFAGLGVALINPWEAKTG